MAVVETGEEAMVAEEIKTIKYTKSYALNVYVELFDERKCTGCPAKVGDYTIRCAILSKDLPRIVIDGVHDLGRLPDCPLTKIPEQVN